MAGEKSTARSGCATRTSVTNFRRAGGDLGGAGPGPILGSRGEAGGDWIVLNVGSEAIEFRGSAHPVIEGFVLPKMFSLASKNAICVSGGHSL